MLGKRVMAVLGTLLLRGLGSGVAVLFTLLVSRFLPTEAAARFFLLFNICAIAAVCFRWGLDEVIIRRVASLPVNEAPPFARQLVALSHHRVFIWSLVALSIVLAMLYTGAQLLRQIDLVNILVAVVASTCIALTACAARVQQGIGRTNFATFLLNIVVPGLSLLGLLVMLALGVYVDARALILLYALVTVVVYFMVVVTHYGNPIALFAVGRRISWRNPDGIAANKLGGVVLAQQALGWTALLLVPLAYGAAAYKGFVVVQKVATLISLLMLAVNFTFSARFAALHASARFQELRRMIALSVISILLAGTFITFVLILVREEIFTYARLDISMDSLLAVLLVSQVFFSLASLFSIVLSMARDDNFLLVTQAVVNTGGVIMFFVLSGTTGIETASITLVVAYFALALILGLRVLRMTSSYNRLAR